MSIIIDSIRGTDILIAFTKLKKLLQISLYRSANFKNYAPSLKKHDRYKPTVCAHMVIVHPVYDDRNLKKKEQNCFWDLPIYI